MTVILMLLMFMGSTDSNTDSARCSQDAPRSIRLAPDGSYVIGTPVLAPDGTFVGGDPHLAPDGSFVGDGQNIPERGD